MTNTQVTHTALISSKEVDSYYTYLLNAFKQEFRDSSHRQMLEYLSLRSRFDKKDGEFLKQIVVSAFDHKNPYPAVKAQTQNYQYPIELLDYVVSEGYTPSSPFIAWAHKRLGVRWNPQHWFKFAMRDIAPRDLEIIQKEFSLKENKGKIPQTLEFYYRLGTGLERLQVHPDLGVRKILREGFEGNKVYKGFDPIDYMDYYYGGLDAEDMTIARNFYGLLLKNRRRLPKRSTALIVGNGPVPDEAQTLAMIPEIETIIPADVDPRNIGIMRMHTGNRNPLATQKARSGEEHSDFIYYLFEKYTKARFGFFAVREITAVKTVDPIFCDVSKRNPLDMQGNLVAQKKLKADLVVVPFCPESITSNLNTYKSYMANIGNLIGKGKHLCMLALKNAEFYTSGNNQLNAVPVDEQMVNAVLTKIGFGNIEIVTIDAGLNAKKRGFSDSMIIWATKQ